MDYVTRQLINLLKKFRKEIRPLADALRKDIKQQTDAIRETRNAYNQSRYTAPVLRAELQVPHTIEVQTSPKDKKTGREWFKLMVETLTLLGVIAYAIVAVRQWREMIAVRHQNQLAIEAANRSANAAKSAADTARDTLAASERQFRDQQRPYIAAIPRPGAVAHYPHWTTSDKTGPPDFFDNVPTVINPVNSSGTYHLSIAIDIKNYGRSPAINLLNTPSQVIYGPAAEARERALKWTPDYSHFNKGILMTDESETVSTGPDEDQPLVSPKENALFSRGILEAYVVGAVRYEDILRPRIPPYETVYCFKLNPVGMLFGSCDFRETTIH